MYHVVLIDDEPWANVALQKMIDWKKAGFEKIEIFTNPKEALEAIQVTSPDVVVTDISMPIMSGLELMNKIRLMGIDSEIIVVSAHAEFEYAQKAIREGALDYIIKPITREGSDLLIKKIVVKLEEKKLRKLFGHSKTEIDAYSNSSNFKKLITYMKQNYYDPDMKLKDLAQKFYINSSYCSELFKKHTGKSFSQCLIDLRIEEAKKLLKEHGLSITKISEMVGYDYYYFNKLFKRECGITPNQYRKTLM